MAFNPLLPYFSLHSKKGSSNSRLQRINLNNDAATVPNLKHSSVISKLHATPCHKSTFMLISNLPLEPDFFDTNQNKKGVHRIRVHFSLFRTALPNLQLLLTLQCLYTNQPVLRVSDYVTSNIKADLCQGGGFMYLYSLVQIHFAAGNLTIL